MTEILDKLKKVLEDGYGVVRTNAQNVRDVAEEYSKIARLRFHLYQLQNARQKKLELLGSTVYPFLLENNFEGLQKHETMQILLDGIKNIENQIELTQKKISEHSEKESETKEDNSKHQDLQKQINELEDEIEARLKELKIVKEAINKKK